MVLCVFLVLRKHSALRAAHQCKGSVLKHVARQSEKKGVVGVVYALKIGYQDHHGVAHEFTTSSASNPPSAKVGSSVTVFHHTDGSSADVLIFQELYLGYWIWFCIGVWIVGCIAGPYLLPRIYAR